MATLYRRAFDRLSFQAVKPPIWQPDPENTHARPYEAFGIEHRHSDIERLIL